MRAAKKYKQNVHTIDTAIDPSNDNQLSMFKDEFTMDVCQEFRVQNQTQILMFSKCAHRGHEKNSRTNLLLFPLKLRKRLCFL